MRDRTRAHAAAAAAAARRPWIPLAGCYVLLLSSLLAASGCAEADRSSAADVEPEVKTTAGEPAATGEPATSQPAPWDYDPYRVLVWVASEDPRVGAAELEAPLRAYLDRDFAAIWRMQVADAPPAVRSAARRNLASIDYETIAASDPVIAVKRDHPDAIRIRFAADVGRWVQRVWATSSLAEELQQRAAAAGDPTIAGVAERLETVPGDALALRRRWADPQTEAMLVSRAMAQTLREPEAKLITPPISGLVGETFEAYDKIFLVRVQDGRGRREVGVVECDTLMRHFSRVVEATAAGSEPLAAAVGQAITEAFAPMIRIEEAGRRSAQGLVRAGGLILDPESPAMIAVGDVLQPMVRKNNRNDRPIRIGPIEWAYLIVTERDGSGLQMDYHAGRPGGLQGRSNRRTFRRALKVRPTEDSTLVRLHKQDEPEEPLIGYEIYERRLGSSDMSFVGRTDWNGRLRIGKGERPLRLLYVKNGGAVLARLPIVPGLIEKEVAGLSGDDMRLQAEAYIRGVQNAIIDLVAIRELLAARVRLRLEKGQLREAEELLYKLREQPTNERLAEDMGQKQAMFLKAIGRDANQRRKVDEMFSTTRELLSKHISPQLIRELEADVRKARENSGKTASSQTQDAKSGAG